MKILLIAFIALQTLALAQVKVGELTVTKNMKSAGFNLSPDSNMSYSQFQGTNYAYFDTVSRVINIYSLPSLTLSKTITVPTLIKNTDGVTLTKKWFNSDDNYEIMFSGYETSGGVLVWHCSVFSESGVQLFTANGLCGLLYQPGGAYLSIADQNLVSIYKLRDIVVAINSIRNDSKSIYVTQLSDELLIEIPNSTKAMHEFVLLNLNGKQISSSKYIESKNAYTIQLNNFRGIAVLASKESSGELQSRTIIIQ